jgi:hypothetical protein
MSECLASHRVKYLSVSALNFNKNVYTMYTIIIQNLQIQKMGQLRYQEAKYLDYH